MAAPTCNREKFLHRAEQQSIYRARQPAFFAAGEAAFQPHASTAHYKHFKEVCDPIITSREGTRGIMFVSYHKP